MSRGHYALFNELPINTVFSCNGMQARKRSTRTAEYVGYPACKFWYYGAYTLCIVAPYTRLSFDYFKHCTQSGMPQPAYAYEITYGKHSEMVWGSVAACHEFGECVRHSLECAGKLDQHAPLMCRTNQAT